MGLVRDKKKAARVAEATARKTRARIAETEGEAEATEVRLPSWRAIVGEGPREQQRSAEEAETESAPPAQVEATPAEAQEDVAEPEAAPREVPASEQPPVAVEAPIAEPGLAEDAADADVAPAPAEAEAEAVEAPVLRWARGPRTTVRAVDLRTLISTSIGRSLPSSVRDALPGLPPGVADRVSIHTDGAAARAADHLDAEAFTVGDRVYFGAGRFQPHTRAGLVLLSHELAHVAQHGEGRLAGLPAVSEPHDPVERDADHRAARFTGPEPESEIESIPAASANPEGPVLRRATETAKSFLSQGHFAMAEGWSDAGGQIGASATTDAAATAEAFPTPSAELGPETQPDRPAATAPAALQLTDEILTPGADTPLTEEAAPPSPAAPATPNIPFLSAGADGDSSGAQANYEQALDRVPTTLDSLSTDPGPPPDVALDGAADPAQAETQRAETAANAESLRQQAAANVDAGPGPEQVQPRSVRETREVEDPGEVAIEELAAVPRMAEIEAAGKVTQDIQGKTDELGQAQLEAGLAEAKGRLDTAGADADAQQAEAVTSAEERNERLSSEANADQERAVQRARADIDHDREETKREQQQKVDEADVESEQKRRDLEDDVEQRIADDERQIESEFGEAETKADEKKEKAENDAQAKKDEAERDADNDSWWSRALSAIADAFEALTDFINDVFDAAIAAVGEIIAAAKAAATAIINAARQFVIDALMELGEALKGLVDELLGDIFPELAAVLNALIDEAVDLAVASVNAIADGLIAGIHVLLDSIGAAITAILEAYRAALNAALAIATAFVTGDWAALGRMILEAVLTLAGIPPEAFYALIERAMGALDTILDDPGGFVSNVIDAVAGGFTRFMDNIWTHLQEGFFAWVVGPLGEMGISLPTSWDLVGLLGLVLEVLGLTREGIRGIIVQEFGETAGAIFDFVLRYIDALIIGGWHGLWEQIQSDLSSLWDMVIDGIKDYLVETIVTQAVLRIATMFNPVGALLNAIITVWNVYNFLRDNIQRIWGVVTSIVNMIAQIAAGVLQPAIQAVERAISSLVPIAISLLANLLGLGGLTTKVREFIESVREMVRNAIVNLIRRVRSMFSGGQTGPSDDAEDDAAGGDTVLGEDAAVSGGGEEHTVHIEPRGDDAELQVRSVATPAERWIENITQREPWSSYARDDEFQEKMEAALALAALVDTEADQLAAQMAAHLASSAEPPAVDDDSVEAKQTRLAAAISEMLRYGQPADEGIPESFEPHLADVHPQARTDIRAAVASLFTGGAAGVGDWAAALPLIQTTSKLPWWETPLRDGSTFATWAVPNQAEPAALNAAHEVKADGKPLPQSFTDGNVTPVGARTYVGRSKHGIHGRDAAVSALQGETFDVGRQNGVEAILKVQYREMLEGTGGNTTSNDEKLTDYRTIVADVRQKSPPRTFTVSEPSPLDTPPTDEQLGTFRERIRTGIVAAYQGNVKRLHDDIISSGVIPAKYNRIKGDTFEQWLTQNVPGVLDKTPYLLKADNNSEVEAMADGMIEGDTEARGSTLVEAKAYVGSSGPSDKEKNQMRRYAATLGVKKWLLRGGDERMFNRVHYFFSDDAIAEKFWPSLKTLIPNSKRGVFVGADEWVPPEMDDAAPDSEAASAAEE